MCKRHWAPLARTDFAGHLAASFRAHWSWKVLKATGMLLTFPKDLITGVRTLSKLRWTTSNELAYEMPGKASSVFSKIRGCQGAVGFPSWTGLANQELRIYGNLGSFGVPDLGEHPLQNLRVTVVMSVGNSLAVCLLYIWCKFKRLHPEQTMDRKWYPTFV